MTPRLFMTLYEAVPVDPIMYLFTPHPTLPFLMCTQVEYKTQGEVPVTMLIYEHMVMWTDVPGSVIMEVPLEAS